MIYQQQFFQEKRTFRKIYFIQLFHKKKMSFPKMLLIFGMICELVESEAMKCRWEKESDEVGRWVLGLEEKGKCCYSLQKGIDGNSELQFTVRETSFFTSSTYKITCSLSSYLCTTEGERSETGDLIFFSNCMKVVLPSVTYKIQSSRALMGSHFMMMLWVLVLIVYFGRNLPQPPTHIFLMVQWLLGVLGMGFLVLDGVVGFHDEYKYTEVGFLTLSVVVSLMLGAGMVEHYDGEYLKPFLKRLIKFSIMNTFLFVFAFRTVFWVMGIICTIAYLPHANCHLPETQMPEAKSIKKVYWQNHYPLQKILLFYGFFFSYTFGAFSYPPSIIILVMMLCNIAYLYWKVKQHEPKVQSLTYEVSTTSQQCSICLESLHNCEVLRTGCNHVFHVQCLCEWMQVNQVCPIDRKLLDHIEVVYK